MNNMCIPCHYVCLISIFAVLVLGFIGAPLWAWTILILGSLWALCAPVWLLIPVGIVAVIFNIPLLRTVVVSSFLMNLLKKMNFIPQISETEKVALKAGDVWIEQDLFSGKPDMNRLMSQNYPKLTVEEQAFIDGPVEKVCAMVRDWDIYSQRDLPPEAWEFLKKERFFGMIVPKQYGGLGFSAMAHSEVIQKLASRSTPLSITAMVPNSLGPAELLNHFGTDEQKNYYLPRLARGEDIPCFALTEPGAGSDAASITSSGVVFKGDDGKLYLRLNWNKRWITLASVSTVLGLAFRLQDPENHLGKGADVGITCALIPTKTPGVKTDRRHDPMGIPFYNSPTQGKDVVVPIDAIIGGPAGAGKGWGMLMECLGAGRGISLPAAGTGAVKLCTRTASAHATVRRQFGMAIGKFEGIAEPLARIAGFNYMMEAARRYTLGAIDSGSKPPVVTAIAKYYFTELQRKSINDAMDIVAGQAISRGPRNILASHYQGMPISITVEGANILTRTLMIFGQGALRAHPFAFKEVEALDSNDASAFDKAFWGHIGHIVRNTFRSLLLSLSRGWLAGPMPGSSDTSKYYRKLAWASASFAILADIAMGTLGGKLKTKGKTTGRFADILAYMYLTTATLRRFEADGRPKEDLPFVRWSLEYAFAQIQGAFDGLLANMEIPVIGFLFRGPFRLYGLANPIGTMPSNDLDFTVANEIQSNEVLRERHTSGIFIPKTSDEALFQLEEAYHLSLASDEVATKIVKARRKKILQKMPAAQLYKAAVEKNVITQQEFENIAKAEAAREIVIQVDDFGLPEFLQGR